MEEKENLQETEALEESAVSEASAAAAPAEKPAVGLDKHKVIGLVTRIGLFVSVLLMIVLSISCFHPVAISNGFTAIIKRDIFTFAFKYCVNALKVLINYGLTSVDGAFSLIQTILYLIAVLVCLITILISLIKSIIDMVKGNNKGLIKDNLIMIVGNLVVIAIFAVFGGALEAGPDAGLIAGTIIGALVLIAVGVLNFIFNIKGVFKTHSLNDLLYLLVLLVGHAIVFIVASHLRLFSVLYDAICYSIGGGAVTAFIAGYLLFICGAVFFNSLQYFANALWYSSTISENSDFDHFKHRYSNRQCNFITTAVFGIIAIVAAFLGHFDSSYTTLTIVATIFAIIGVVGWVLFAKVKIFEKKEKNETVNEQ